MNWKTATSTLFFWIPFVDLNAIEIEPVQYKGLLDALGQVWAHNGWQGLMRGVWPRFAVIAPSAAISWTAFEVSKNALMAM